MVKFELKWKIVKNFGRSGIRTHASEETGALNQRLRPLGHPTSYKRKMLYFLPLYNSWVDLMRKVIVKFILKLIIKLILKLILKLTLK